MTTESPVANELELHPIAGTLSTGDLREPPPLYSNPRLVPLGEMASALAHELKQPLTAICTYIDCCRRYASAPQSDKLMSLIEKISDQAKQATEIIARAGMQAQQQHLHREQVEPNELIRQTLRLAGDLLRRHRSMIDLQLSPSLPTVNVDPVQIRQVLQNLLINSLEAARCDDREPHRICITTTSPSAESVVFKISDNGKGFNESDAMRLFEPFFSTKPHGAGLGLSISQSIVRAHGGHLWATLNSQGGATFHVELPGSKEASYATT